MTQGTIFLSCHDNVCLLHMQSTTALETKAFSWETLCAVATAMHFMIPVVGTKEER